MSQPPTTTQLSAVIRTFFWYLLLRLADLVLRAQWLEIVPHVDEMQRSHELLSELEMDFH